MKKVLRLIKSILKQETKPETHTKKKQTNGIAGTKDGTLPKRVALGYDLLPTILNEDGTVYQREAELIFNKEYYPNWPEEKWPVDPNTGLKLEIQAH